MWKQGVAASAFLLASWAAYAQVGGIDHVTGIAPIIYSSPEICIQQLPVWFKRMKKEISHTPGKKLLPSSYTEKTENDAVIDYTRTDDPDHRHSIMVSCKGKMLTGIELTIAQH